MTKDQGKQGNQQGKHQDNRQGNQPDSHRGYWLDGNHGQQPDGRQDGQQVTTGEEHEKCGRVLEGFFPIWLGGEPGEKSDLGTGGSFRDAGAPASTFAFASLEKGGPSASSEDVNPVLGCNEAQVPHGEPLPTADEEELGATRDAGPSAPRESELPAPCASEHLERGGDEAPAPGASEHLERGGDEAPAPGAAEPLARHTPTSRDGSEPSSQSADPHTPDQPQMPAQPSQAPQHAKNQPAWEGSVVVPGIMPAKRSSSTKAYQALEDAEQDPDAGAFAHRPDVQYITWRDEEGPYEKEAEELVEGWSCEALPEGYDHAFDAFAEGHFQGYELTAARAMLEQLEGRVDEVAAAEAAQTVFQTVIDDAWSNRIEAQMIAEGATASVYSRPWNESEDRLFKMKESLEMASEHLITITHFLGLSERCVKSCFERAGGGITFREFDLAACLRLCDEFAALEDRLRDRFDEKLESHFELESRAASVLTAIDVMGLENVSNHVGEHRGMSECAWTLARECCDLGSIATKLFYKDDPDRPLTRRKRAELLDTAAATLVALGEVLWLAGVDRDAVLRKMRGVVVREFLQNDVPFAGNEALGKGTHAAGAGQSA